jgi:hypothetical protein
VLWALAAARMGAGEFAPFDDIAVGLEQLLFQPAGVVGIERLGGFARPDVVVVETIERLRLPAALKFFLPGGFFALICAVFA